MGFDEVVEDVGKALDGVGVAVIVLGVVVALAMAVRELGRGDERLRVYQLVRRRIGRMILLGLEVLVGADIIRTVATTPTFSSVGVLAAIVAIRTFLSFALEAELEGRWPWRRGPDPESPAATG